MDEETVDRRPRSAASAADAPGLTRVQAAQAIGVSRHTIHGWIKHGALPVVWSGQRRAIAPADLAAVHARLHLGGVVMGPVRRFTTASVARG